MVDVEVALEVRPAIFEPPKYACAFEFMLVKVRRSVLPP